MVAIKAHSREREREREVALLRKGLWLPSKLKAERERER